MHKKTDTVKYNYVDFIAEHMYRAVVDKIVGGWLNDINVSTKFISLLQHHHIYSALPQSFTKLH